MKIIKTTTLTSPVLIFFCICMVMGLAPLGLRFFKANASKKTPPSSVKTSLNLEILPVQELGPGVIQVIVKNGYQKDITALVATTQGKFFRRDYVFAELERDQKLAPGASDEFLYNLEPGENVVITAVLFADNSSAGNPGDIQKVLERRWGMKAQLARINPYLEQLYQADPRFARIESQRVKQIAEGLRIEKDNHSPMSEDFEYGLRDGRAFILKNLPEMEAEPGSKTANVHSQNQQQSAASSDAYEKFHKRVDKLYTHCKKLERRL